MMSRAVRPGEVSVTMVTRETISTRRLQAVAISGQRKGRNSGNVSCEDGLHQLVYEGVNKSRLGALKSWSGTA